MLPGPPDPAVFIPEFLPQHGIPLIHGCFANLAQHDVVAAAITDVFGDWNDLIATLRAAARGRATGDLVTLLCSFAATARDGALAIGLLAPGSCAGSFALAATALSLAAA
jgi:hypothetical protein